MLSVTSIRNRLQTAFGAAQDSTIQGAELDKFATALYNSFTIYPELSPLLATAGSAQGTLYAPPGTFLNALQNAFPTAQNASIQTSEFTKLANGIEASINNDAVAIYPLMPGTTPFVTEIIPGSITAEQVFFELKSAFGVVQDSVIQDSSLMPFSQAIVQGLNNCIVNISLTVGGSDIIATGTII